MKRKNSQTEIEKPKSKRVKNEKVDELLDANFESDVKHLLEETYKKFPKFDYCCRMDYSKLARILVLRDQKMGDLEVLITKVLDAIHYEVSFRLLKLIGNEEMRVIFLKKFEVTFKSYNEFFAQFKEYFLCYCRVTSCLPTLTTDFELNFSQEVDSGAILIGKKQTIGTIVNRNEIKFDSCQGFVKVKETSKQRTPSTCYCQGCSNGRNLLGKYQKKQKDIITISFPTILEEKQSKKKSQPKKKPVTPLEIFAKEQYEMSQFKGKGGFNYLDYPLTLQTMMNLYLNGYSSLTRQRKDKDFLGPFFTPSKTTINRHCSAFCYRPGFSPIPMELFLYIIKKLNIVYVRSTLVGDEISHKKGVDRMQNDGFVYWVGGVEYDKTGTIAKIEKCLHTYLTTHNSSEDEEKVTCVKSLLNAIRYVRNKDSKENFSLSKEILQTHLNCTCLDKNGKEVTFNIPLFWHTVDSVTQETAKGLLTSTSMFVNHYVACNSSSLNFRIDSICWDSKTGIQSFFNDSSDGIMIRTSEISHVEFPYVLKIPILPKELDDNTVSSLEFAKLYVTNDEEHLMKEAANHLRSSTGFTSEDKCFAWPTNIQRSGENLSKITYTLCPAVFKVIRSIILFERTDSTRISKLSSVQLNATTRDKMKTRLAREIFCEETIKAINRFVGMYEKSGKQKMVEERIGVSMDELRGTKDYIETMARIWNIFAYKGKATSFHLSQIEKLRTKLMIIVSIMDNQSVKKSMKVNSRERSSSWCPLNTLKKLIRNCRVFEFMFELTKDSGSFRPYFIFISNCAESHFQQMRTSAGTNLSVTAKDYCDRTGKVFLRKQQKLFGNFSYENNKFFADNHIFLNRELISKLKKLKAERNKAMIAEFEKLIHNNDLQPMKECCRAEEYEKFKKNTHLFSNFQKVCGKVLLRSSNTLRSTNRQRIAMLLLKFLSVKLGKSQLTFCKNDLYEIMYKMYKMMSANLLNCITSGFLPFFEELMKHIFLKQLSKEFCKLSDLEKVDKLERKTMFQVIVQSFVHGTLRIYFKRKGLIQEQRTLSFRSQRQ